MVILLKEERLCCRKLLNMHFVRVACLAGDAGKAESADLLCEQTKVPRRYLHKVLQDLVRAELVRSRSGPGGGYTLARVAG